MGFVERINRVFPDAFALIRYYQVLIYLGYVSKPMTARAGAIRIIKRKESRVRRAVGYSTAFKFFAKEFSWALPAHLQK